MFASGASKIRTNPKEYQGLLKPLSNLSANHVAPLFASNKTPNAMPPLPLYTSDGEINHLNHYYYYNHLAYFESIPPSHLEMIKDGQIEAQKYHHPVSGVNLEDVVHYSRHGITNRRDRGFRSTEEKIPPADNITNFERDITSAVDTKNSCGLHLYKRRKNELHDTNDKSHESDSSKGGRKFSLSWRMLLPRSSRIFSQSFSKSFESPSSVDHSEHCIVETNKYDIPKHDQLQSGSNSVILSSSMVERILREVPRVSFSVFSRHTSTSSANISTVPDLPVRRVVSSDLSHTSITDC
ncbi:hypothetical protein V1514DRAFT_328177 [Lipomyces japonicus]|uniref:uncharacterized protein n=1 Tax=Lipomyces japonicus TaxID=56871 RepID=UPI0034CF37A8